MAAISISMSPSALPHNPPHPEGEVDPEEVSPVHHPAPHPPKLSPLNPTTPCCPHPPKTAPPITTTAVFTTRPNTERTITTTIIITKTRTPPTHRFIYVIRIVPSPWNYTCIVVIYTCWNGRGRIGDGSVGWRGRR